MSIAIIMSVMIACKTKEKAASTASAAPQTVTADSSAPKTTGKVSHQYKDTGCATVVIVKLAGEENPMTLIPKDKLPDNMDVDGKEIMFDYRPLKMPNPKGCTIGIPAELTNLKAK